MGARPILFSGPMVRALLDGRKTQTRRVIKDEMYYGCLTGDCPHDKQTECDAAMRESCPYGKLGGLLWVRESFSYERLDVDRNGFMPPWYWADGNPTDGDYTKPKPSIHMPRRASRLTLEITDVRVQRLQDITEEDAKAEGVFFTDYGRRCFHQGQGDVNSCPAPQEHHPRKEGWMWQPTTSSDQCLGSARSAFGNLWSSINGPDGWNANPWVWALSFRIHHRNVDAFLKGEAT